MHTGEAPKVDLGLLLLQCNQAPTKSFLQWVGFALLSLIIYV